MNKFKISDGLKHYIEVILIRRRISYVYRGPNTIMVDVSKNMFHKIVLRAKCEKRNEDENLDEHTTYWIPKAEDMYALKGENPDMFFFVEFD